MAYQLMDEAAAAASSSWLNVRSVGAKIMPLRVVVIDNDHTVTIKGSPISTGTQSYTLGTIAAGGGTLVISEPVSYIQAVMDALEAGTPDVWVETSR